MSQIEFFQLYDLFELKVVKIGFLFIPESIPFTLTKSKDCCTFG